MTEYLGKYNSKHIILDPEMPMAVDPLTNGDLLMEYRYLHLDSQKNALAVIDEVDKSFKERFDRSYGGLIEEYRMDDAEYAVVVMGSMTGVSKDVVDSMRSEGKKIGLVKIRALRPFPKERVIEAMKNVKAFGVIDRNVSFGWNTGVVYQEIKSALYEGKKIIPSIPFIGGLGGEDITYKMVNHACELIMKTDDESSNSETVWLTRK